MLTDIQYRILKKINPTGSDVLTGSRYERESKLRVLLGDQFLSRIPGKTIIDFGCGEGTEAIEMARRGAKKVIGLDIREEVLQAARRKAAAAGLNETCVFAQQTEQRADIIVSIDAFEHFRDPGEILRILERLLEPQGEVVVSFGPPWHHPLGGHLFSVFPWAHLVFSESALIRWRSTFKTDGATRFGEVSGGLNQMTIKKFESLIAGSALRATTLELVPIRRLRAIHNRLTREFTTAVVRCRLVRRDGRQG